MPRFITNKMSESLLNTLDEISVVDVYDLASEIGKECEKIIEKYGTESVSALIPKVINSLELLEALATRNESENSEMQELHDRIAQLETEKTEKAEYRKRFDKELETIEEQWRGESRELLSLVSRLQDENQRLQKDQKIPLSPSSKIAVQSQADALNSPTTPDGSMFQKLKSQLEKNRDELKIKDREVQEKNIDIDQLNLQIERLKYSGRESRRRQKMLQVQLKTLCEERADFLAQLQDQHREIVILRKRLGIAEKENEDLVKSQDDDDDDPQRPRFTTAELKDVLAERNELKSRINDLEEELQACRPIKDIVKAESPIDEEPPVQGPLPFEPDDAPWKKSSESGIRKFFRKLFSDEPGSSSFPRRSLSTLSKMALSSGPHSDIPI